jgi:hypothetical protein
MSSRALDMNDLKAVTRVFGLSIDDMLDTARAVQPQLDRQERAYRITRERAQR